MALLQKLITDKTDIMYLDDDNVGDETKHNVLDLNCKLSRTYIKNMYFNNDIWYYFKKDIRDLMYPFCTFDELIGSYLSAMLDLPTVRYSIAKNNDYVGIVSSNFKEEKYNYKLISDLVDLSIPLNELEEAKRYFDRLETLRTHVINRENDDLLLKHLFTLFAVDIYMLQQDRGDINLQFQIDKKTGYFDIAPIYDYANCASTIELNISSIFNSKGIVIPNKIVNLDDTGIKRLAINYPLFKEIMKKCIEIDLQAIWYQICKDYHFNMNSLEYQDIYDYYEMKSDYQKRYIKELLK